MNKPTVELKNVRSFQGHDGQGLNADIWINGIKCIRFHDGAYGGGGEYNNYLYNNPQAEQVKTNVRLLEDHIKSLPEKNFGSFKCKMDMDIFVNELYNEIENLKTKKKLLKRFASEICYGVPNANSYCSVYWKGKTLAQIPLVHVQKAYNDLKLKLGKGEVVLNTNLTELGIKI